MSTQYLFVAAIKAALKEFQINCAKLQVQTQIIDKMLWQLCYGKISFIVLIPVLHPPVASPQLIRGAQQLTEDEGLYLPNFLTNFVVTIQALSQLFFNLINTTAYYLGISFY